MKNLLYLNLGLILGVTGASIAVAQTQVVQNDCNLQQVAQNNFQEVLKYRRLIEIDEKINKLNTDRDSISASIN